VPTALERTGGFSQSVDQAGTRFAIRDCATNSPFPDGKIPANRIYGIGLNILKIYPLPNRTGTVGFNYGTQQPSSQPRIQDLIRLDYNISSNWRTYGRFVNVKNNQVLPYGSFVLATNIPDFIVLLPNPRTSMAVTVTGSITPTTILEATIGGSHNSTAAVLAGKQKHRNKKCGK